MSFVDQHMVYRDDHPGRPPVQATTEQIPLPDFGLHMHPESADLIGHPDTLVEISEEIGARVVAAGLSIRPTWRDEFEFADIVETGMLVTLLESGLIVEHEIGVFF